MSEETAAKGTVQLCTFYRVNPFTGNISQHAEEATETVYVPLVVDGKFYGDGVEAKVCKKHMIELADKYGAVMGKEDK